MVDRDLRRAIGLILPYWRRLALVMALSLASTAVSLSLPLLSRDVFDGALLGRDAGRLVRIVGLFSVIACLSWGVRSTRPRWRSAKRTRGLHRCLHRRRQQSPRSTLSSARSRGSRRTSTR